MDNKKEVIDSTFTYVIRGGEHDGEEHTIDLYVFGMVVRELEKSPEFKPRPMTAEEKAEAGKDLEKEYNVPTPEFAMELSSRVNKLFGFCTPNVALEIWGNLDGFRQALKKNTEDTPN